MLFKIPASPLIPYGCVLWCIAFPTMHRGRVTHIQQNTLKCNRPNTWDQRRLHPFSRSVSPYYSLSISLSMHISSPFSLSTSLPLSLSLNHSESLHHSLCISLFIPLSLSLYHSRSLSVSLYHSLSLYISLSVSLYHFLSLYWHLNVPTRSHQGQGRGMEQ